MSQENDMVKRMHRQIDSVAAKYREEALEPVRDTMRTAVHEYIDRQTDNEAYRLGFREYFEGKVTG